MTHIRKQALVVLVLCAAIVPRAAFAQAKGGDKEVLIGGNFFAISGQEYDSSFGQFNFGVGFFASDRFEIAFQPTFRLTSSSSPSQPGQPEIRFGNTVVRPAIPGVPASTTWNADAGFATKAQYFTGAADSKVKPYIGATFIIQSFKTSTGQTFADNTYAGSIVGIKSYLSAKAAFDFNTQFGFQISHPRDLNILTVAVGITYLF